MPFNKTRGHLCMVGRFLIDITHQSNVTCLKLSHSTLLNSENILERIFSLSIEFLYRSVSESSKSIHNQEAVLLLYSWSKPKKWSCQCGPICKRTDPSETAQGLELYEARSKCQFFIYFTHCTDVRHPYHFKADGKYIFWDFCNVRLRYNGSIDYYEDGPLTAVIFSFYYKVSAIRNETKYTHKTLPINILQTHESHIRTSGASNCIITIIIITIIIIIKHFKDAGFQVTTTTTSILHFSICERTKTCRGKENIYLFCKYFKDITRWCKSYKKIRDFWDDK